MKVTCTMYDMSNHFIGVDVGGTTTRVVVAAANGHVVGRELGPGANLWSSGASVVETVTTAIEAAISDTDRSTVEHGVIAMAGGGSEDPKVLKGLAGSWAKLGLHGTPSIVDDVVTSYAAGTVASHGLVLAVGTGAVAARISNWMIRKRAGGHGWLVGDEGSGVWLGTEAVRAALRGLDGRGPRTALVDAIVESLDAAGTDAVDTSQRIVRAVYTNPPAHLGRFAPIVARAYADGDPVATALVEEASQHLLESLRAVADDHPQVLVLAGSIVTAARPIADRVRDEATASWPGIVVVDARSGEAGAVALAIAEHTGEPITDAVLSRLRGTAPRPAQRSG